MRRDDAKGAVLIAALLAALGMAPSVSGDLLVTRDGSRIETQGPWEVRGRLVVFTRSDGVLASMRLREVDLEASEEATAAAAARKEKEASETGEEAGRDDAGSQPREAAWVLTDADFTRRLIIEDPEGSGGETDGEPAGGATSGGEAARPPVVLSYQREFDVVDQHVRVTGTLANKTRGTATAVSLEVSLFDEQGDLVEMRRAELAETMLSPGAETSFLADFPDVYGFSAVQFRPRSANLETAEGEGARIPGPDDAAREEEELGTAEPPGG